MGEMIRWKSILLLYEFFYSNIKSIPYYRRMLFANIEITSIGMNLKVAYVQPMDICAYENSKMQQELLVDFVWKTRFTHYLVRMIIELIRLHIFHLAISANQSDSLDIRLHFYWHHSRL